MRNTTICRVQLHPSTEESAFERAVLDTVFPATGDRPRDADRLFVRSLYRARTEEFPPAYACLVDSLFAGDSNFFTHGRSAPLDAADLALLRLRFRRSPCLGATIFADAKCFGRRCSASPQPHLLANIQLRQRSTIPTWASFEK